MGYISRETEAIIKKLLPSKKVLMVLGARQVGKTTLLEHLLANTHAAFLNLDIEVDKARLRATAALSPTQALHNFGSPQVLVIDEAQRLPEMGRLIKGWYDAKVPCKIALLGSSSVNLLDQIAEALTGRNEKVYLPPLTFREIVRAQPWYSASYSAKTLQTSFASQLRATMRELLIFGSYPEAVTTTASREQYLLNLASDYVLKDILQLGLIKSPDTIKQLLLLLAHQIGSLVSVSELAQNLQIARQTVVHYINLLERNFVIFRLPALSTNQRKELSKSSKIYFWDTGVRNALLKEFSTSEFRGDIGALWENWVIAEFSKRNLLQGGLQSLYFWRTTTGSEVDLVIKDRHKFKAYEISWSRTKRIPSAFTNLYKSTAAAITKDNFVEYIF